MKATFYYSGSEISGPTKTSKALKLFSELLEEHGQDAFELELVEIEAYPDAALRAHLHAVPYLVIFDGERQELPIMGDFEAQKLEIAVKLRLRQT